MSKRNQKIVVSDTTLIINLIHASMLCLLGAIPGYFFVVPDEVVEEVTYPDQAQSLLDALEQGWLASESITDPREIELYTYFRNFMGKGEAACLALAEMRGLLMELRPAALVETSMADLLRQLGQAVSGREGIPVTVLRGLCGGAIPTENGIILSLERMNEIDVDKDNLMETVVKDGWISYEDLYANVPEDKRPKKKE